MRKKTPRITSVSALGAMRLTVSFDNGWSAELDLTDFVAEFKSLKPLHDAALFTRVAVEEWGSGLTWEDKGPLSIAATTLYRLACEQAQDPARSFDAWMMQHGFSAAKAADVLGMSRRNIINYSTAAPPY